MKRWPGGRRAPLLAVLLLAACSAPPAEPPPSEAPPLRPLARQPATPADTPRSQVPMVRYDLAVGRTEDEAPADDEPPGEVFQRGGASYYGVQFHQRRTANGERFDMGAFTAAHKTLPFNSRVCVRSLVNGREVLVRVNDRGPFVPGRVIDLSQAAAEAIGMIDLGIKQVALTLVGPEGGRCAGAAVAALEDAGPDTPRAVNAQAPPAPNAAKPRPRRQARGRR